MIPHGIKDRFELYQKWFKVLLTKEFLNLSTKYQEKFLVMAETFLTDCRKIHEEGKVIKEKAITLTITEVFPLANEIPGRGSNEKFQVYCRSYELKDKVVLPVVSPEPKVGDKLNYIVFSLDGNVWYSSKEELINKTKRSLS